MVVCAFGFSIIAKIPNGAISDEYDGAGRKSIQTERQFSF